MKPDLSDRGVQAALILIAAAAFGFVILGLAWGGVAAQIYTTVQSPFVASGAIGGVALAGTALALLAVHVERRRGASDRHRLDGAIRLADAICESLPATLSRPVVVHNGLTAHRLSCRSAAGKDLPRLSRERRAAGVRPCRICRPEL